MKAPEAKAVKVGSSVRPMVALAAEMMDGESSAHTTMTRSQPFWAR
jgi:hypothetical protein